MSGPPQSAHIDGMGTMIRKVLGYGLTDLVPADDRINWDSPLLDMTAAPSFDAFADHLLAAPRSDQLHDASEDARFVSARYPHRDLSDCVVHDPESGSERVLVLVPPPYYSEWLRADDTFDYMEAHFEGEPTLEPLIQELRTGIPPFDGRWMDKETGAELHKFNMFRRLLQSGDASPEKLLAAAHHIAALPNTDADPATNVEPLFADAAAAATRLIRLIPIEVRELASFGALFTSPDVWKSLVPVHYTYWA